MMSRAWVRSNSGEQLGSSAEITKEGSTQERCDARNIGPIQRRPMVKQQLQHTCLLISSTRV